MTIVSEIKLSDWSETLSFDEIEATLFLVGLYLNKEYNRFSPEGLKEMEAWMTRNDAKKFAAAHDNALIVQEKLEEDLAYAQELIGMPYRIPMSH